MKIMLVAILLITWLVGYAMFTYFERMDDRLDELEHMVEEESTLLRMNLERMKSIDTDKCKHE